MRLTYKAVDRQGKVSRGVVDANDITEAANYLRDKNLIPVQITREQKNILDELPFFNKASTNDLILFTRQLSSMLASGLTLMRALEILKDQLENQRMIDVVNGVINDVEEGKNLSTAIAKYPNIFSPIYVSIIKAGESAGLLDKVLSRLADNLEKEAKLKSTVKSALMYPIIVVVLMVVVIGIMMIFVIPQLTLLYQNLGVSLPLPTQIIIALSNFTTTFWPFVIGGVFGAMFAYKKWSNTNDGRLIVDSIKLKIPVFGKLIKETILAEFSRTFGLLIGTGSLVVDSLMETADTTGNVHYKTAIVNIAHQVEKGVTVGDAMSYYPLFPQLLVQLVKIGEQTGKVDESLEKASEYFEREVDEMVKGLTTAMEPFIMVVLGLGVAFLIISVITPIYSLISSIQ